MEDSGTVLHDELLHAAVQEKIGRFSNIETHMSKLYLGDSRVVKTFKPINLGFVDMTPLEKRRQSCINTARIDSAYSPDLKTSVATVIYSKGTLTVREGVVGEPDLAAGEEIRDYAIVMRRFDSSNELKVLYKSGNVTKEHGTQIGALLAEAHQKTDTDREISNTGFDAITANFDECFRITKDYIGRSISREDYESIYSSYHSFVNRNGRYLEKRRDSGFIRRCHGDTHSGNMFLEDGRVKIFDGIGFKDEFSFMDVVSDFAFAYMDAVAHGQDEPAEAMKRTYVEKTGDAEGVERLLDFYVSYRAFVRGEVTTMKALNLSGVEKEESISNAMKYFQLSKKHALKSLVVG